jgi:hypothetical protein
VIPSVSETAATPKLIVWRWIAFLSVMSAVGLLGLRLAIARPVVRRVSDTSLRNVSIAFFVASAVGLVTVPIYVLVATADFALRSVFAIGALVPLVHASAFGRGFLDLWLCFALFVAAGVVAIWVDRPDREHRSVAELLALIGAVAAAAATLRPARPAIPRRPRRAASRWGWTGCTSSRGRSGSAGSSASWCSGAAFRRRSASPASSSPCRAFRSSRWAR